MKKQRTHWEEMDHSFKVLDRLLLAAMILYGISFVCSVIAFVMKFWGHP